MENSPTLFQILAQKPKRKMLQWGEKKKITKVQQTATSTA